MINEEILKRITNGPPEDIEYQDILITTKDGLSTSKFGCDFCKMEYFPNMDKPSHVILWTKDGFHVFDYHSINYIQINAYVHKIQKSNPLSANKGKMKQIDEESLSDFEEIEEGPGISWCIHCDSDINHDTIRCPCCGNLVWI